MGAGVYLAVGVEVGGRGVPSFDAAHRDSIRRAVQIRPR
jgi:hypothetical protein